MPTQTRTTALSGAAAATRSHRFGIALYVVGVAFMAAMGAAAKLLSSGYPMVQVICALSTVELIAAIVLFRGFRAKELLSPCVNNW